MGGLLAEDVLLTRLPVPGGGQWHARLSFPSQLRDSRGFAPLSASPFPVHASSLCIMLLENIIES
jgi:hypothetical protein